MHVYLWRTVEGVRVQDGLYHYQRLGQVLPHELVSVIAAFIRTVVEHLQEWRSSQVEHELRKEHAVIFPISLCCEGHSDITAHVSGSLRYVPEDTARTSRRSGRNWDRLCDNLQISGTANGRTRSLLSLLRTRNLFILMHWSRLVPYESPI